MSYWGAYPEDNKQTLRDSRKAVHSVSTETVIVYSVSDAPQDGSEGV